MDAEQVAMSFKAFDADGDEKVKSPLHPAVRMSMQCARMQIQEMHAAAAHAAAARYTARSAAEPRLVSAVSQR